MAVLKILKRGELIGFKEITDQKARAGYSVRLDDGQVVKLVLGQTATVGKFELRLLPGAALPDPAGQGLPAEGQDMPFVLAGPAGKSADGSVGDSAVARVGEGATGLPDAGTPAIRVGEGERGRGGEGDSFVIDPKDIPVPLDPRQAAPGTSALPAGPAPKRAADEPLPELPGYKVVGRLGEGGMGTVWRAVQLSTNRPVAVKMMNLRALKSRRAQVRFQREVELAAKLEHPNVARIYDSGLQQKMLFYAMELVDGRPLDKFADENKLNERQRLELLRAVALAVGHAHQRGVIHRDLKPANILVTPDSQPHVLDFGLAKAHSEAEYDLTLTVDGQVLGTPAYMSPEQASGVDEVDARSDVYSLGVILYQLLAGTWPHDMSGKRDQVLARIAGQEVRPPRQASREISQELETLLLKALAHDASLRYQTAGELAADIAHYLAGEPLDARRPTLLYVLRKRLIRHRWTVGTVAAAVLITVIATTLMLWQFRTKQTTGGPAGESAEVDPEVRRLNDAMVAARTKFETELAHSPRGLAASQPDDWAGIQSVLDTAKRAEHDGYLDGARKSYELATTRLVDANRKFSEWQDRQAAAVTVKAAKDRLAGKRKELDAELALAGPVGSPGLLPAEWARVQTLIGQAASAEQAGNFDQAATVCDQAYKALVNMRIEAAKKMGADQVAVLSKAIELRQQYIDQRDRADKVTMEAYGGTAWQAVIAAGEAGADQIKARDYAAAVVTYQNAIAMLPGAINAGTDKARLALQDLRAEARRLAEAMTTQPDDVQKSATATDAARRVVRAESELDAGTFGDAARSYRDGIAKYQQAISAGSTQTRAADQARAGFEAVYSKCRPAMLEQRAPDEWASAKALLKKAQAAEISSDLPAAAAAYGEGKAALHEAIAKANDYYKDLTALLAKNLDSQIPKLRADILLSPWLDDKLASLESAAKSQDLAGDFADSYDTRTQLQSLIATIRSNRATALASAKQLKLFEQGPLTRVDIPNDTPNKMIWAVLPVFTTDGASTMALSWTPGAASIQSIDFDKSKVVELMPIKGDGADVIVLSLSPRVIPSPMQRVALTSDGRHRIYDLADGGKLLSGSDSLLALSPMGDRVAAFDYVNSAIEIRTSDGKPTGERIGTGKDRPLCQFSPDGKALGVHIPPASGRGPSSYETFVWENGKVFPVAKSTGPLLRMAFSPNGKLLAVVNTDVGAIRTECELTVVEWRTQLNRLRVKGLSKSAFVAFDPCGLWLACVEGFQTLRIYSLGSADPVVTRQIAPASGAGAGAESSPSCVSVDISPDGQSIIFGVTGRQRNPGAQSKDRWFYMLKMKQ